MTEAESLWDRAEKKSEIFADIHFIDGYDEEMKKIIGEGGIWPINDWDDKGLLSLWLSIACINRRAEENLFNIEILKDKIMALENALSEKMKEEELNKKYSKSFLIFKLLQEHPEMKQKDIAEKLKTSEVLVSRVKSRYLFGGRKKSIKFTKSEEGVGAAPAVVPSSAEKK